MKSCPYCGNKYPDEATVCSLDGQLLQSAIPTSPPPLPSPIDGRQHVIDDEHIKLLAIFHFVLAGLALCGLGFLCLHYLLMSTVFSNPEIFRTRGGAPPIPKDFFKFFIWFYVFMGGVITIAGILNLLSGIFLRQRIHRTFCFVVAGLNCLQIPFGTALGIFTFMVLSRESVRVAYTNP